MLRKIDFTPDAPAYELLQQSLLMTQAPFPIGELSAIASLQKKFAAIGIPLAAERQPPGGIVVLRSTPDGGSVIVEEAEYAALVKAFEGVGWTAAIAERVTQTSVLLKSLVEWLPDLALVPTDG